MRKLLLAAAASGLGLLVSGVSVQAALESFEVSFTASDFTSAYGEPVPTDPVTGSFIITFDPTQTYTDQTVGITLKSLNIGLGSALAFDYSPTGNGNGDADELVVGGLETGACCIYLGPTSADMYLHILTFTSSPTFGQVGYRPTTSGTYTDYFYTDSANGGMGSVTVTSIPVPEASTWAMMIAALPVLGFLGARGARRASALAAPG